jgi:H+/Cl- antiporter ClcA
VKIKYRRKIVKIRRNPIVEIILAYFKYLYDKTLETNSTLKIQFFQFFPFLIASVLTGFTAFLYNGLFRYSEKFSFYLYHKNPIFIFITTPLTFIFSWWLVKRFAPTASGSGIPQVMLTVELCTPQKKHLIQYFLGLKIIFVKIVSSCIKVMGGGIVGREGPTIQISSSIFNKVYSLLPKWWQPISQKNILIAGAASGLAAAFNTPLGGIIFAIEELSKYHIKYYKSPLFIAVIIAGLTAQGFGGAYLYLEHPKASPSGFLVYVGIFVVALFCGIFGTWMGIALLKLLKFGKQLDTNFKQLSLVIFCAMILATTFYILGVDAMGSGKSLMEKTLFTSNKSVEWYLPFARMGGLIASFGSGGSGGVFAPSLSSGASFGAWIADWLHLTGENANLLILIGMTSFLTAVTRAPFTSAIIVFEMTDRHSIIFFLLVSAMIANLVASLVSEKSLYEEIKEGYLHEINASPEKYAIKVDEIKTN